MNRRLRTIATGFVLAAAVPALVLGGVGPAAGAEPTPVPPNFIDESVDPPVPKGVSEGLKRATGTVEVTVRLAEPAIAESVPEGAVAEGTVPSKSSQRSKKNKVAAQQDAFVEEASALGAEELGRTELAANLVAVSVDASQLEDLAALDNVISITPISRHETHGKNANPAESGSLAQAIDYVQAAALHKAGYDGTGIRVAVLDSGIDYTHKNLGGPGTIEVYDECFAGSGAAAAGVCATLFGPGAPKVKGGFDFVGDVWPNGDRTEDPNPLDAPSGGLWSGGHGTHVADIIGGRSADGTHKGIAPGVSLYAVKVCSAVSTSCNGVSMLLGLDWALDPNGDGDISDAVDIVNMSLGSSYGQDQDDSSFASENLVHAGVVVVASAGNSADRPFIVGSPSSAPSVISVAQTALPDDLQWVIQASNGATISNSVLQSWSPAPTGVLSGALARPADAGGIGCSPAAFAGFPAGSVALIQRGTCNISDKAVFAQSAGAVAAIIYNNAPGDPPSFSFGSTEPVTIPTLSISQADGQALVAALAGGAVSVTIDPASAIPLTNTMVGTSSRGTTVTGLRAKPDIGAPGAWLSAETATGDEETNFGGTSGAAPVVSGAAALLLDKFDGAAPATIKARLLNSADYTNRTSSATGFYTTPITRIGSGEVRVAPAAAATGVLSLAKGSGNIGLGIPSVTSKWSKDVTLKLTNTSKKDVKYSLDAAFRDAADKRSGAVSLSVSPKSVTVPKGKSKTVKVKVAIKGSKLAAWPFDSVGANGAGATLNDPEFDGWVTAKAGKETLRVGWTVLPRKAADVSAPKTVKLTKQSGSGKDSKSKKNDKKLAASIPLKNKSSVASGVVEVFALGGTSPDLPESPAGGPGTPGSNAAVIDLAAVGVRQVGTGSGSAVQFAIATHERRTVLPYPAEFDVYLDSDNDGVDDFVLYNGEVNGFAVTGQTVVWVYNLETNTQAGYYYVDGGFHSSTQIFTAPAAAIGLVEGQTFAYSVYAYDNYFTGVLTDAVEGVTHTWGQQKYTVAEDAEVPPGKTVQLKIAPSGATGATSQSGVLLINRSAASKDFAAVVVK